jgi:hypothetical protein
MELNRLVSGKIAVLEFSARKKRTVIAPSATPGGLPQEHRTLLAIATCFTITAAKDAICDLLEDRT